MFWTGMRPSECTALRIGDVDLKNGFIIVNKSRTLGEENATKTAGSTRTVRLLPHVAAVLRSSKELRVTGAARQGDPERAFYCTRHTFISLALTTVENIKAIAEHCGTSVPRIESITEST